MSYKIYLQTTLILFLFVNSCLGLFAQTNNIKQISLGQQFKTENPKIQDLTKNYKYKEAFSIIKKIVPIDKPVFDTSDPKKGLESSQEYSSLMAIYSTAGKMALMSGDWRLANDYFHRAREIAMENYHNFNKLVEPILKMWQKSIEDSTKLLLDNDERRKKILSTPTNDRTPSDQETLKTMQVWESNVNNGQKIIKQLRDHEIGLKKDSEGFSGVIDGVTLDIKKESDWLNHREINGNNKKYVNEIISNTQTMSEIKNTADKAKLLYRLNYLDPMNKNVEKQLISISGDDVHFISTK